MDIFQLAAEVGLDLTPVQRVVLKLMCGIPLDAQTAFPVRDIRTTRQGLVEDLRLSDEVTYVEMLKEEGRFTPARDGVGMLCVVGRQGGITTLLALMALARVHRQCHSDRDQAPTMFLGGTKSQADWTFQVFRDLAARSSLVERRANRNQEYDLYQNDRDIEETGPWLGSQRSARASVRVGVAAARLESLRGRVVGLALLDGYSSFPMRSGEDMLRLLETRPDRPTSIVCGQATEGPMRDAYDSGKYHTLRIPTWEMGHTFVGRDEFIKDGIDSFYTEWGAEFLDEVCIRVPSSRKAVLQSRLMDAVSGEASLRTETTASARGARSAPSIPTRRG